MERILRQYKNTAVIQTFKDSPLFGRPKIPQDKMPPEQIATVAVWRVAEMLSPLWCVTYYLRDYST